MTDDAPETPKRPRRPRTTPKAIVVEPQGPVKARTVTAPYLRVPQFERMRHYANRLATPWIKVHDRWLEDYRFARLNDAQKLDVLLLWLLANRCGNLIPNDPEWITYRLAVEHAIDLNELCARGFLEPAPASLEGQEPGEPSRVRSSGALRQSRKARPQASELPPEGPPEGAGDDDEAIPAATPTRAAELLGRFNRRQPL